LKEPKNAVIRQYQKLFEFDHVKLHFKDEALHAIAKKALELEMGARGLRSILERIMLNLMFEVPSQSTIRECIVSEDTILHQGEPILLYEKAS
jgi:ATP-dependent Clp protease ATP-binding subunit ClpX